MIDFRSFQTIHVDPTPDPVRGPIQVIQDPDRDLVDYLGAQLFGENGPDPLYLLVALPVLSPKELDLALQLAASDPSPAQKARALAILGSRLDGAARDNAFDNALLAIQGLESPTDSDVQAVAVAFGWMAPYLTGVMPRLALNTALIHPSILIQLAGIGGLARYLSPELQKRALDHILAYEISLQTAAGLAVLAPYLAPADRATALAFAQNLTDDIVKRRLLTALEPPLTEPPSDLAGAVRSALEIQDAYVRGKTLLALAPFLSDEVRSAIYVQVFLDADTIQNEDTKSSEKGGVTASIPAQLSILATAAEQVASLPEAARAALATALRAMLTPPIVQSGAPVESENAPKGGGVLGIEEPPAPPPPVTRGGDKNVPPPEDRVVSTGISTGFANGDVKSGSQPLTPATHYYYWFTIGPRVLNALDRPQDAVPLPAALFQAEAKLDVVLFDFKDELVIEANRGSLQLKNGSVRVARQPDGITGTSSLLETRLFFPIHTPAREGSFRLRCNLYYEQILLQSRLVTVTVMQEPVETEDALTSVLDYVMTDTENLESMLKARPHRFSILANDNGDTTVGLRFYGKPSAPTQEPLAKSIPVDGQTATNWRDMSLSAMRRVSWGNDQEWTDGNAFRYKTIDAATRQALVKQSPNFGNLANDLGQLAVAGSLNFAGFTDLVSIDDLRDIIYEPGSVQIALKAGAQYAIPAALMYDYPWNPMAFAKTSQVFTICPTFAQALVDNTSLQDCDCFQGNCPVKKENTDLAAKFQFGAMRPVVCPSGFWGFRHSLGLPVTYNPQLNEKNAADMPAVNVPPTIYYQGKPQIGIGVSTDPTLTAYTTHAEHLKSLGGDNYWGNPWQPATTSDQVMQMLGTTKAQLIYFYCHGDRTKRENPFLDVGDGKTWISPSTLTWIPSYKNPNPLVFLNGCETVVVKESAVLSFVSKFAAKRASGVIGTEITVADDFAAMFAEQCLHRFIVEQQYLGDAVRNTRLSLLQDQLNPLGLIYTPFAFESLRMLPQA